LEWTYNDVTLVPSMFPLVILCCYIYQYLPKGTPKIDITSELGKPKQRNPLPG